MLKREERIRIFAKLIDLKEHKELSYASKTYNNYRNVELDVSHLVSLLLVNEQRKNQ